MRAIEAAALLHDMGKLAMQEYILNKPGKLTGRVQENEATRQHWGRPLVSNRLPYPVVPIVRHHHENWNGKGYPNGMAGTDIPIGARILSVVDCFDALTSDRPYRPRLSERRRISSGCCASARGNMYDPLVVDTFIAAPDPTIAPASHTCWPKCAEPASHADGRKTDGTPVDSPLRDIRATAIPSLRSCPSIRESCRQGFFVLLDERDHRKLTSPREILK